MKEPLPEPFYEEVIIKSSSKPFESKISKEFEIYTPKDKYIPCKKMEKKDDKKKTVLARKDKNKVVE